MRSKYAAGCRCQDCTRANREYARARTEAHRRGETDRLIDAAPARLHLLKLSRAGVGRTMVAESSGVARSGVCLIRYGIRTRIRDSTARRILAVSLACRGDATLVSAAGAWRKIARLLEEGYTKGAIARMMGKRTSTLQLRRKLITVRNRAKLDNVYQRLMS